MSGAPAWMAANSCSLRTLALVMGGVRDEVLAVADRLAGVLSDTASHLGWYGPAADAASRLGQERAGELRTAVAAVDQAREAVTRLADGLDEHAPALQDLLDRAVRLEQATPPDPVQAGAARQQLELGISEHVERLAALDRESALALDEAGRRLAGVLASVGTVQWLGGVSRVVVRHAATQTGVPVTPAPAGPAPPRGAVGWPFHLEVGGPACGANTTASERACSGLNGAATAVGDMTAMVDALTTQAERARGVLADPTATAGQRDAARAFLAEIDRHRGAERVVALGSDTRYLVAAGRVAPVVGGVLAGWSGYTAEIANGHPEAAWAVGVTEGVVDTGIGMLGVASGAQLGAAIGSVVPGPGTAVGAVVGAGAGGLLAYVASDQANQKIQELWEERLAPPAGPATSLAVRGGEE